MQIIGQKLAERAILRASSGLYFIDDVLRHKDGSTDGAYSRSWYILLSFNFELILNSLIAFESKGKTNEEVSKEITSIKPSHDFERLSKSINPDLLKKVGIISVKKQSKEEFIEYKISTKDGNIIYVQDLVDVRYDFKKDALRKPDPNEISRIKAESKSLRLVIDEIKKLISTENAT